MSTTRNFSFNKEEDFSDNQSFDNYPSAYLTPTQKCTQSEISLFPSQNIDIQPPRQIPKKAYSLQADMATGWKPRKNARVSLQNVFSINFSHSVTDQIVKQLVKTRNRQNPKYSIVYLGPRPVNSYVLHQNKDYDNPYPVDKKVQSKLPERSSVPNYFKVQQSKLKFDSKFESGNLDLAIEVNQKQYDLFMRVDSNTKGHTNWFYFAVKNGDYTGIVKFNICNFKREKSLYQRGLKPFVKSLKNSKGQWKQQGKKIRYERKDFRYKFLYDEDQDQQQLERLKTYFALSFQYEFETCNDRVEFAYCVPYTYTRLISFLGTLENVKQTQLCKTLSGLAIPLIQVTDQQIPQYDKKVVLVTARIHPGQANSSHVAEGFLQCISSQNQSAIQLRKHYHFYVVPMLNPDGVVAGNYRTSLFGKDLNRTFNQNRRFAFPQAFHLMQLTEQLKKTHKQRFGIYLDLHGHSVKKNVFMYGPDFNIQHSFYEASRQLPKILGSITTLFRFYSCTFKISNQKSSTARAVLNRVYKIPFTYTMQSSNGLYFDHTTHSQKYFTAEKWKQMGKFVGQGLHQLKLNLIPKRIPSRKSQVVNNSVQYFQQSLKKQQFKQTIQKNSDDQISEGKSDSQPQDQDLPDEQLNRLEAMIEGEKQDQSVKLPQNTRKQISNRNLSSPKKQPSRGAPFRNLKQQKSLPPIFTQNRQIFLAAKYKRKRLLVSNQRPQNMSVMQITSRSKFNVSLSEAQLIRRVPSPTKMTKNTVNKIITDVRSQILSIQQNELLIKRKDLRRQMMKKSLFSHRYF